MRWVLPICPSAAVAIRTADDDALGTVRHGPTGGTNDMKNRILSPAYEAPMYDYSADSERGGRVRHEKKRGEEKEEEE